ncbi:tetratricopeptide repeat protein [Candidatus Falkowbacteria bacterium]|nr:tetratricopeptide repeat protein [Candidatus Falkowbacteria bacterium]
MVAAKKMRAAEVAYQSGDYDQSIELYRSVLETVPTSKTAHIGAAEAIFSNNDKSDDEVGLALLRDIPLNKDTWARVTRVMPVEYQQYFRDVK